MGFFEWLKQKANTGGNARVAEWRRAWAAAASGCGQHDLAALAEQLDALGPPDDDLEVEREMLDGLVQLGRPAYRAHNGQRIQTAFLQQPVALGRV